MGSDKSLSRLVSEAVDRGIRLKFGVSTEEDKAAAARLAKLPPVRLWRVMVQFNEPVAVTVLARTAEEAVEFWDKGLHDFVDLSSVSDCEVVEVVEEND